MRGLVLSILTVAYLANANAAAQTQRHIDLEILSVDLPSDWRATEDPLLIGMIELEHVDGDSISIVRLPSGFLPSPTELPSYGDDIVEDLRASPGCPCIVLPSPEWTKIDIGIGGKTASGITKLVRFKELLGSKSAFNLSIDIFVVDLDRERVMIHIWRDSSQRSTRRIARLLSTMNF